MKSKKRSRILVFLVLSLLILLFRMIDGPPWWSFIIPVMVLGACIPAGRFDISYFPVGFSSGFFVWISSTLYYHLIYEGVLINRIGMGYGVIALIASGMIGGLLTGLAFYAGKSLTVYSNNKRNL